ncbi:MAG: hypothetical protein V4813_13160 [Gemmatimonadota bacterium]
MRPRRPKPQPPRAEELAPFVIAIPTRIATEPVITHEQVLIGLQLAAQLAGPDFAPPERAHLVAPPAFARPLHTAYHAWPAHEKHASLSFVLGEVATPFTLMLLIRGGNTHPAVLALFREAMIRVLLDARGSATRTSGLVTLLEACVDLLGENFESDAVLARLVMANALLRWRAGLWFADAGLLPWDLPGCLQQPDFFAAVRALYAEAPLIVVTMLANPRLRSDELAYAFSLFDTHDTHLWLRGDVVEALLKNPSVTAAMFPMMTDDDWREVASRSPTVLGNLWSAFYTDEWRWLGVFAALAASPFPFTEYFNYFAERMARWGPQTRAVATQLLMTSPVPATAMIGRSMAESSAASA